ncbi:MAG: HAD-IA family hydrolase [Deltaproteobacteria bacterium]|nr:HAD-IA family hydrolase [Deltaproteobacteria bacterium]
MRITQNSKLLLFDLGGMLVDFSGIRDLSPMLRTPRSEDDIRQKWSICPTIRAFETGLLTPVQFSEQFVATWDLNLTPASFLHEFRTWTRGFLQGAQEILVGLKDRFRLACLSNSNASHWEQNQDRGLFAYFESSLSSHMLGYHKPDPLIYQSALDRLHLEPEAVIFFDDSAPNVEGAQKAGIRAFQVSGVSELCVKPMPSNT